MDAIKKLILTNLPLCYRRVSDGSHRTLPTRMAAPGRITPLQSHPSVGQPFLRYGERNSQRTEHYDRTSASVKQQQQRKLFIRAASAAPLEVPNLLVCAGRRIEAGAEHIKGNACRLLSGCPDEKNTTKFTLKASDYLPFRAVVRRGPLAKITGREWSANSTAFVAWPRLHGRSLYGERRAPSR